MAMPAEQGYMSVAECAQAERIEVARLMKVGPGEIEMVGEGTCGPDLEGLIVFRSHWRLVR